MKHPTCEKEHCKMKDLCFKNNLKMEKYKGCRKWKCRVMVDYKKFPIRLCHSMHKCAICDEDIQYHQTYYDGGLDNRAHIDCGEYATSIRNKEANSE